MGVTTRRGIIGPVEGEAGDERSRIEADTELSIRRTGDGTVVLRQETVDTPNFEKVIESRLSRAEAIALRNRLDGLISEG
jgi:hypothetical protein